jgi:hypothetical protein
MMPDFEIILSDSSRISKREYATSSLTHSSSYGQAYAVSLNIVGADARALEESGLLREGAVLWKVKTGFDGKLTQIAKNLTIGDTKYKAATRELTVNAYGVSWRLRNSQKSTRKLTAKTYADAALEIAKIWGVPVVIGKGAYQPFIPKEAKSGKTPTPTISTNASSSSNAAVLRACNAIIAGDLTGITSNTRNEVNWCAQLVRQVVERGLGLGAMRWALAREALRVDQNEENNGRDANDYAQAAKNLKWTTNVLEPGCLLYQENVSLPFGHISIYVGSVSGVPSVLENTTVSRGIAIPGAPKIRLTSLAAFGAYTLISTPNTPSKILPADALGGSSATVTASAPRAEQVDGGQREVIQKGKSDWNLLTELAREIGYVLTETPDGSSLYFGPGLEVGARDRLLLVLGEYQDANAGIIAPNILDFEISRQLHHIPTEVLVTGYDGRKRFVQVVSVQDLAQYHKVTLEGNTQTTPTTDALGNSSSTVTATAPVQQATNGQTVQQSAEDFANKPISSLLSGTPYTNRFVIGQTSNKGDARDRALSALALERLRLETVSIPMPGDPRFVAGGEVLVRGSEIPTRDQGLWLLRDVQGMISDSSYKMDLTLNRNVEGA